MSRIFEFATGRRVLYGLGTLIVGGGLLFGLGPFPRLQAAAPGGLLPEQQLGYGPGQLLDFLDAIGAEGRTAYLHFQRLDILTPLLIGGSAALAIAWLLRRAGTTSGPWTWLPFVPALVLVAEVAENYVLVRAVHAFPAAASTSVALPVLTAAKFSGLFLTVAVVVGCAPSCLAKASRRRACGLGVPAEAKARVPGEVR